MQKAAKQTIIPSTKAEICDYNLNTDYIKTVEIL